MGSELEGNGAAVLLLRVRVGVGIRVGVRVGVRVRVGLEVPPLLDR